MKKISELPTDLQLKQVESLICEEFFNHLNFENKKRLDFIKHNKLLKFELKQNLKNKNKTKKKRQFKSEIFSPKSINEESNTFVNLNKNVFIPRSIFCYPCKSYFRQEEDSELKYIMKFNDYETFNDNILNLAEQKKMFVDYPHNRLDEEIVTRKYFLIWIIIRLICNYYRDEKTLNYIIYLVSGTLNKKFNVVYNIFMNFLNKDFNTKRKPKINVNRITNFRMSYCQKCFDYYCKRHCYYSEDIKKWGEAELSIRTSVRTYRNKSGIVCPYINNNFNNHNLNSLESIKCCCKKNIFPNYSKQNKTITTNDFYIIFLILNSDIVYDPCFISKQIFNGKYSCNDIKKLILLYRSKSELFIKEVSSNFAEIFNNDYQTIQQMNKYEVETLAPITKRDKDKSHNDYLPCIHEGNCEKASDCSCAKVRGICDKFCACKGKCAIGFKGCNCKGKCWSECSCLSKGRECDKELCKCYDKCCNMSMTKGEEKKLCLGKSFLGDFLGVYTLEDIKENEFICEYTGEVASKSQAERKTIFLNFIGSNYLYNITEDTDIDAYRFVCKMRYVNHSSHGYANSEPKSLFVNGDYRIGLYAARDIKKGEEIYFDYLMTSECPWLFYYDRKYRK